jgi:hypothetical protein
MGDDHDGGFGRLLELHHEIHDDHGVGMIQIARGFISKQYRQISYKSSRYSYSLLFTTTELMWISHLIACQSYLSEYLTGRESPGYLCDVDDQVDVVLDGEIGHQMKLLKHKTYMLGSPASTSILIHRPDIRPIDTDSPAIRDI